MSVQSNMILDEALEMAALMLGVFNQDYLPDAVENAIKRIHKNVSDVRGEFSGLRSSQTVALIVFLYEMGIIKDE